MRVASWLDKTAFVLCDVKSEKTALLCPSIGPPPRSILRKQAEAAELSGVPEELRRF